MQALAVYDGSQRIRHLLPRGRDGFEAFSVKWFVKNYGERCWELDAMDPRDLRNGVQNAITALIDRELWEEQEAHQEREKKSIEALLRWWADIESVRGAVA
jgi:hypothetical protein